jgi:HAD superfamily hydrolase (TIGR01484 family)
MIKLFVLDLDGCVTFPFVTPHWPSITKIRDYNLMAASDHAIPRLTICTGRPFPYAEAFAQWLDIHQPLIFESGGGVYLPTLKQVHFSEAFFRHEKEVAAVRACVQDLIETEFSDALLEFSKKTDAGVIHADEQVIIRFYERAKTITETAFPDFEVHRTEVSVNIILKQSNKGTGLEWISQLTGIPLTEIAYIGDSGGDVPALKRAGRAFAPANATAGAKQYAEVMSAKTSEAVLQAYELLIEANRREIK